MKTTTNTMTVEVYDPPMCCSTGVCGPDVDQALVDFSNNVKWLKSQGIDVKRYNLGQEPEAFKSNVPVITRVQKEGTECLPIIIINGEIVSEGGYPDKEQLKQFTGMESEVSQQTEVKEKYNEITDALIGIGAAVAAGDKETLQSHFSVGQKLGVSNEDLSKAMQKGLNVRQKATTDVVDMANNLLGVQSNCAPGSGCC